MQFYNAPLLHLLWLIPALLLAGYALRGVRGRRTATFALPATWPRISLTHWPERRRARFAIFLIALALLLLALARPQWGSEKHKVERRGIDMMFVVDTSLSMLVEDLKPSRIRKTKLTLRSFIQRLKGDRVGLVAFAGSSFLQTPMTLDYGAFNLFLDALDVGLLPDPGSAVGDAIERAVAAFPDTGRKNRVIVLFSDGEFHDQGLPRAIDLCRKKGVRVYAVGMGTLNGQPIPLRADKTQIVAYKKDRSGQVVISKLDEQNLERLARETGGLYFPSTPGEREVDLIYADIGKLGKEKYKEREITEREDHFQLFLAFALVLLIADLLVSERRKVAA